VDTKGKKNSEKGASTEEMLATYFRTLGYFVVRGVKVYFKNQPVTDIDLWMYARPSLISKEIVIVDIKNKKNPQACERMLWTKGLQLAVGANRAIVATTESNKDILEFSKKVSVDVIGGSVLKEIKEKKLQEDRITEEEFQELLKNSTFGKIDGDWRGRIEKCKVLLSNTISFSTINYWMEEAKYFANQIISRPKVETIATRCLFIIISYICVGIDSISKEVIHQDKKNKYEFFINGFTYGNQGFERTKSSIEQSINMVKQYGGNNEFNGEVVRMNIYNEYNNLGTEIISDYFSNDNVLEKLVELAIEIEKLAMNKTEPNTFSGSTMQRSTMGCLLDFWAIDRNKFGLMPPQ